MLQPLRGVRGVERTGGHVLQQFQQRIPVHAVVLSAPSSTRLIRAAVL
jgi:hypothetical protein